LLTDQLVSFLNLQLNDCNVSTAMPKDGDSRCGSRCSIYFSYTAGVTKHCTGALAKSVAPAAGAVPFAPAAKVCLFVT